MNQRTIIKPDYLPKKKIELPRTRLEIYCEFFALVGLIAGIIYLVVTWPQLPEKIPSHFNFSGTPDSWAGKGSLLLLPGVSVFIYLMLSIFQRF